MGWTKELKKFEDMGFGDKDKNIYMLIKYAVKNEHDVVDKSLTESIVIRMVKNEHDVVDKSMTESIVIRMLKKQKLRKMERIEEETQNEKEADSFLENEWDENVL